MEITEVRTTTVNIPFKSPYEIGIGDPLSTADAVLVRVNTTAGITGIGEARPFAAYFSHESVATLPTVIENHLGPALEGRDPRDIVELIEVMDQTIRDNPSAKSAIEMACYDILGKDCDVPVATLLGGRYRERIAVGKSIGIQDVESAVDDARDFADQGVTSIKVKVGKDPAADTVRTKAIMDAVGDRVPIRIDANGGYSAAKATKVCRELEEYGDLLLIEQPISRTNLTGMAELTDKLDTPVLADESVFSPVDGVEIVRRRAADILNIKVQNAGGLYKANQIAAIAAGAEMPVVIGAMMETGVGTAASAHLAASIPHATYPSDVKAPDAMTDSILKEPIRITEGYTHVPEGPGLGVTLDEKKVERYRAQ